MHTVQVNHLSIGQDEPLTVICGPCVIESEAHVMYCVEQLVLLFERRPVQFIFKASYDKANRSSIHSFRGPGIEEGLKILEKVKQTFNIPLLSDVHSVEEVHKTAHICDVIQIPAFLCRQTDLLLAAGKSNCVINVKKGQFTAPWDMREVIEKIRSTDNKNILLTDRGTCFGYNNLVSDMRAIPIMQKLGYPVIYDATHSVQLPGALNDCSGGQREFIPTLTRAALAAGCNGIYAEVHPNPEKAKSDAASVLSFEQLPSLLDEWQRIYDTVHFSCSKSN